MSVNYVELKVSELREECKTRNLDTTGLKVHLVERLTKYDKDQLLKNLNESKNSIPPNNQNKANEIKEVSTDLEKQFSSENISESNADSIVSSTNIENNDMEVKAENAKILEETVLKTSEAEKSEMKEAKKEDLFSLALIESENWDNRTDVHLDYYNSDMNIVICDGGYSAIPLYENGFEYMCGAVKANYGFKSGKIYYEVNNIKKIKADIDSNAGESNFIKVGWSVDSEVLTLGEKELSFAYDGWGKKISGGTITDYGTKIEEGSVIGCFLEFSDNRFVMHFSVNGVNQGTAFDLSIEDLKDLSLVPHIYVKNMSFEVNFGQKSIEGNVDLNGDTKWTFVGKVDLDQRTRILKPPISKSECEVLMMCGLPSCGKTYWTEKHMIDHPSKRYNVLSVNTVLEKMKVINLRKKVSSSVWDSFISSASNCLNKLMEIAVFRKRNFILDQTNVYPSAQRRRMKPFEEFIRKAIIIVPTDDEYQRRMNQVIQEEGKDVPESAVLQLKENFVIPEENSDLFNEIIFIELQRFEAEELIRKYNEEAKNLKNKDSNGDNSKRKDPVEEDEEEDDEDDDERFGKWGASSNEDNNEPSAPKKSRWNDQVESRKRSRSKERYDRNSSEKLPRKNDYKEASDSGRSGRSNDNYSNRYDDKYSGNKSRDQRGDRLSNRSSGLSDRKSGYNNDRRSNFENRDDSRFGGRNFGSGGGTGGTSGSRDSRARDRGGDSRGGGGSSGTFDRNRSRGYNNNNRRTSGGNSYNYDGDSRTKFSQPSNYSDRGGEGYNNNQSGFQDRNNRFGDRNDFRGRGRGRGGNQGPGFSKESSFNERRNVGDSRDYGNYSDYDSNRQSNNKPWQQDYKNSGMIENSRREGPDYDDSNNFNRLNHISGGFDQQYGGGARGAMGNSSMMNPRVGGGTSGGDMGKMSQNQYSDRKPMRGGGTGQTSRGASGVNRFGGAFTDSGGASMDDYSYSSSKNYESMPISKFDSKPSNSSDMIGGGGGYKDTGRAMGGGAIPPYNSSGSGSRGRFNKFDDGHKPAQNLNRNYGAGTGGVGVDNPPNQKDHNYNSQYNQNSQYYKYYTGANYEKDQSSSSYQTPHQQSSWSAGGGSGAHGNFNYSSSSNHQMGTGGTSYQSATNSQNPSSNMTGGSGYPPFSSYQGSNTAGATESYQSSNQMSRSGGVYHSSSSAGGTGGYQSYQTTNQMSSASGGGAYHQTANQTAGGYAAAGSSQQTNNPMSSYQTNSYSAGGDQIGYQSSNQSMSATTGNVNTYTNPYNAIYENSYFGSGYHHGQTANSGSAPQSYGDSSKTLGSNERSQQTIGPGPGQHVSSSNNQAAPPAWGTGYGDYSQYYGQQQYGQK